jgi:hypothetical protein
VTITTPDHPKSYQEGTRVLMLTARHKDGHRDERKVFRVSHDEEQYSKHRQHLLDMLRPGERIYATAAARNVKRASRIFRERQLAAEYDQDPMAFYRDLQNRWISCLMNTTTRQHKLYLFDCDSTEDIELVRQDIAERTHELGIGNNIHTYRTKSGMHVLTPAFDGRSLSEHTKKLLHADPLMLIAWSASASA